MEGTSECNGVIKAYRPGLIRKSLVLYSTCGGLKQTGDYMG